MRVAAHVVEARRESLSRLLERHRYLSVPELCRRLGISEATARRDLASLKRQRRIRRTHGGAMLEIEATFASLRARARKARMAKDRIADAAYRFVRPCTVCYLDAGTTMLALARRLRADPVHPLTLLTNNLAAADLLNGTAELDVRLLGGRWLRRQALLVGHEAKGAVGLWEIDTAFLSAEAMDASGLWNTQPEVIELQRLVIAKARRTVFCLDASKLGQSTRHMLTPWGEVDHLVTDASPSALQAAQIPIERSPIARN
jgi:DeoR/GlpR family transcriptional regulator of sugar metabolism